MSGTAPTSGRLASTVGNDTDVQISRENQKKINTFAIRNGWLEELNQERKQKENEIKNLEDAEADILMFEDDQIPVPILVGDCYIHYSQDKATGIISGLVDKTKKEIEIIQSKITTIKTEMSELRSELYSQFGDNINLENEDE